MNRKKQYAEFFTPDFLVQEMIDRLPPEVWTKSFIDLSAGDGNFLAALLLRKVPLRNIYGIDILEDNVQKCRQRLLDIAGHEHKKIVQENIVCADALSYKFTHRFGTSIGNPPYQPPQGDKKHKLGAQATLWDKFVLLSLQLADCVCLVHPANWRRPEHPLWPILSPHLQYLEIHSAEDGLKTFGASTRYDWYVYDPKYTQTVVKDEKGVMETINLKELPFLPNWNIKFIMNLMAGKRCRVLFDSAYHSQRISKIKTNECKFPCFYSMNKKGYGFRWSDTHDRGHFGVAKVIVSKGRYPYPYNDYLGEYGMTETAFGLLIDSKEEGDRLVASISSPAFIEVIKATRCNTFNAEYRMFRYLKNDFWRDFQ